MIRPDTHKRVIIWMTNELYADVQRAARAVGDDVPTFVRERLASSILLSQAAARSGCAGDGEVGRPASPELST